MTMGKAIGLVGLVLVIGVGLSFMMWRSAAGVADELQAAGASEAGSQADASATDLVDSKRAEDVAASSSAAGTSTAVSAPEADVSEASRQRFELQYGSLTDAQLMDQYRATNERYGERMETISDRQFAEGNFEVLEGLSAKRLPQRHSGPLAVYRFNKAAGTAKKTILLESDYPDVYELREASRWIETELKRRGAQ